MSKSFGDERRRVGRRVRHDPNYSGPERRIVVRRQADREPMSKLGLFVGALAVLVVADAVLWNGQYRHAAISSFNAETAQIRDWGAHVWDMG